MTGDGFPCRSTSSPGRQARSYTASKAGKFPRYVSLQMGRWVLLGKVRLVTSLVSEDCMFWIMVD